MNNDQLLGEIHASVKNIEKRFDRHLDDYDDHKKNFEKVEKRQVAFFGWISGIGFIIGSSATALFHKLTGL
jgi:uncharacterized membrane protein YukC